MLSDYHEIMQSGMVEFVIGKDRRRFSIHRALTSFFPKEILQLPINVEVDEIVFGRCCDFVYPGDYSVPLPVSGSDGGQPSDSQTLSPRPTGRWDPANLTRNLFHPTILPGVDALILERLDKVPRPEEGEDLNIDPADSYAESIFEPC